MTITKTDMTDIHAESIARIEVLAKHYFETPFTIGDTVQELDMWGGVLKEGILISAMLTFYGSVRCAVEIADDTIVFLHYPRGLRKKPSVPPFVIEELDSSELPQCTIRGCNGLAEHHTDYGHLCEADYLNMLDEGVLE